MKHLIEDLYNPILFFVKKRVSNTEDAEDLTQEVFLKLYKSKSDHVENVKSWIYTIASNSVKDYYKKKKIHTQEIKDQLSDIEQHVDSAVNELTNCIVPFINQLPKDYAELMKMSEIENLSQKEIAEQMNVNYVTVRSKIQRGRIRLKELISSCCTVIQGGKGAILDFKKNDDCNKTC